MSEWLTVAKVGEIEPGDVKELYLEEIELLLVNLDGQYYTIENLCTHDGAPLESGEVEDGEIVCPRHGARFCVKTGAVTCPPAYEDLKTYPTRIVDDQIQVKY